jgi:hypothetical protein
LYSQPSTVASAFTLSGLYHFYTYNAPKGAGSTITTQYGVYVENLTSGATNYAIYTAGATNSAIGATAKLYFDGGGNTYITESSADVLDLYAGGAKQLSLTATSALIAGIGALGGAAISTTTAFNLPASTTGVSSLRVAHGTAPTSPVNGDIWTDTSALYVRINGVTKTVAFA